MAEYIHGVVPPGAIRILPDDLAPRRRRVDDILPLRPRPAGFPPPAQNTAPTTRATGLNGAAADRARREPPPLRNPAPPNRAAAPNGVPAGRARQVSPPPRNPALPNRAAAPNGVPTNQTRRLPPPPGNPVPPNRIPPNRVPPTQPLANPPPPPTPQPTCLVCSDPIPHNTFAIHLPCTHHFCASCFLTGFHSSLTTMPFRPLQCCQQPIPIHLFRGHRKLSPSDTAIYRRRLSEFDTPRPTYCHDRKCSAFIPDVLGGKCRVCRKKTCTRCRWAAHAGVCMNPVMAPRSVAEVDERRFKRLSVLMGWKTCPVCGWVVEKVDGCNHIQCKCGCHFCYRCGKTPYGNHGRCAM